MKTNNEEIKKLNDNIKKLYNHNIFKIYNSSRKLIIISFFRGLASGLGWVLGATILVSFLTFSLSKIEFIPIIGELVSQLILEIEKFER
ncbi:MAG: hypothetical protein CMP36_03895 [Rickettsiales bacterium]|nr:hypothetical protein [Rickettsiales bacterium]OUV78539.1 MAG: hypothetical protein CBC91_04880 [Rickettsiales bacterium TMED131]|tara:strand:- start:568 stop:834 length:267 start_codon:yes stop_codon:yes gene_type:complete